MCAGVSEFLAERRARIVHILLTLYRLAIRTCHYEQLVNNIGALMTGEMIIIG